MNPHTRNNLLDALSLLGLLLMLGLGIYTSAHILDGHWAYAIPLLGCFTAVTIFTIHLARKTNQ